MMFDLTPLIPDPIRNNASQTVSHFFLRELITGNPDMKAAFGANGRVVCVTARPEQRLFGTHAKHVARCGLKG